MREPGRIVIVGGGFAGLHLVRRLERLLRKGEAQVTLVDRNNYHLFTPLLYQVATGELPPHAVAYPLRRTLAQAGFRFVNTEVEGVDIEPRVVHTPDGHQGVPPRLRLAPALPRGRGLHGPRAGPLLARGDGDDDALEAAPLIEGRRRAANVTSPPAA